MVKRIKHQPPSDERYRKKYDVNKPNERKEKEQKDTRREELQLKALSAILDKANFNLVCILAKIPDVSPYENYSFPSAIENLEFELKGLLRIEMIGYEEDGKDITHKEETEYRRLLGTSKEEWKMRNAKELPKAWASRVSFKAFESEEEAKQFLEGCPLRSWGKYGNCIPLDKIDSSSKGKFVLLQVHDCEIESGKGFSELLKEFINGKSQVLTYVHSCDCLNFKGGV